MSEEVEEYFVKVRLTCPNCKCLICVEKPLHLTYPMIWRENTYTLETVDKEKDIFFYCPKCNAEFLIGL